RERVASSSGGELNIFGGDLTRPPQPSLTPGSDEHFQKLLLRIAAKASERSDAPALIRFFCQNAREFFQVPGVYFWRRVTGDELVGEQAAGKLAERFVGLRLSPTKCGHCGSGAAA